MHWFKLKIILIFCLIGYFTICLSHMPFINIKQKADYMITDVFILSPRSIIDMCLQISNLYIYE